MGWLDDRGPRQSPGPDDLFAGDVMVGLSCPPGGIDDQVVIIVPFEVDGVARQILAHFTPAAALEFGETVMLAAREIELGG